METQPLTVARFIAERVNNSKKSQTQIAKEIGFNTPNLISMLKTGTTRLPINKVPKIARALATDPVELLVMCFKEYQPENWEAIKPLLDLSLTSDERRLIRALRFSIGGLYLASLSNEAKKHLEEFLECLSRETASTSTQ
ncbi:MAG: helix-turn-helix transcriptional regulator [Burkholderiales bacterium]